MGLDVADAVGAFGRFGLLTGFTVLVGFGVGVGCGLPVGFWVGLGVLAAFGVFVGFALGFAVGFAAGVGLGVGAAVFCTGGSGGSGGGGVARREGEAVGALEGTLVDVGELTGVTAAAADVVGAGSRGAWSDGEAVGRGAGVARGPVVLGAFGAVAVAVAGAAALADAASAKAGPAPRTVVGPTAATTTAVAPAVIVPACAAARTTVIELCPARGSPASQAAGPIATLSRRRGTVSSARTTSGSKCVPAQLTSSRSAASRLIGRLYGRAAVIASKQSATQTTRAPKLMSSPRRPAG